MGDPVTINLRHVARGLDIPLPQVQAVVELLDEGNTVPFVTRYRKDQTGGLDEEQIRQIQTRLSRMRMLAERKQTILRSIELQGKQREADRKTQLNRVLASQNAMAGARGSGLGGSNLAIFEADIQEEALETTRDRLGVTLNAEAARSRGRAAIAEGKLQKRQSRWNMAGTMFQGIAQAASMYGSGASGGEIAVDQVAPTAMDSFRGR